jgi:head-tail adaptor
MSVVLNRRLVLEAASRLPDGAGGYAETWVVLGELWADIRSGAGRDTATDMVAIASVTGRWRGRSPTSGSARAAACTGSSRSPRPAAAACT